MSGTNGLQHIATLVRQALDDSDRFRVRDDLSILGLNLQIQAETAEVPTWIRRNLDPMPLSSDAPALRSWRMLGAMDTGAVDALLHRVVASDVVPEQLPNRFKPPLRLRIDDHIDLFLRGLGGVAWIVDRENQRVLTLVSARERYPMQAMFSTARKIIVAHMRDTGWHVLHAAAVDLAGSTRLILGNSRQGKTSLAAALMAAGAGFVGNDRVFLQLRDGAVHAVAFPMPIGIGLGTAMQHPGIDHYITHWGLLGLPQRRLRPKIVKNTPRAKLAARPDKLQLLSKEITSALSAPNGRQDSVVSQVLMPNLREGAQTDIGIPNAPTASAAIAQSVIPQSQEHDYPNWLSLGFGHEDTEQLPALIAALQDLPSYEVTFFSGAEGGTIASRLSSTSPEKPTSTNG